MSPTAPRSTSGWIRPEDAHLADLLAVLEQRTDLTHYPHAERVEQEVLVYDSAAVRQVIAAEQGRLDVQAEIARALADGPGIVVFTGAYPDGSAGGVLDRTTSAFVAMIDAQRASGVVGGDHFAKPGANDRIWNALEKLAVDHPDVFVDYYANDLIALAATAWLGPAYQVTSQLNVVNPGGEGQTVHRDYHLGFQSSQECGRYPAHVHALSASLTLQGAVAHVDMPVESGPRSTCRTARSTRTATSHTSNRSPRSTSSTTTCSCRCGPVTRCSSIRRCSTPPAPTARATSSAWRTCCRSRRAFGRAMETVDRERVVTAIYPALLAAKTAGMPEADLANAVAASAEGYAFPTNLDRDQPIDGMSPRTQAEIVTDALASGTPPPSWPASSCEQAGARDPLLATCGPARSSGEPTWQVRAAASDGEGSRRTTGPVPSPPPAATGTRSLLAALTAGPT